MGLYNMLFGVNPDTPAILRILGWTTQDIPRFRNACLTKKDGNPVIAVYTRMGSPNRECWEGEKEIGCTCPACRAEAMLEGHTLYLANEDDDFDPTYATYYFRAPEDADLSRLDIKDLSGKEKWNVLFQEMEKQSHEKREEPDSSSSPATP